MSGVLRVEELLEQEVQRLEAHFLSGDDPMGRGFVSLADVYRRAGVFDRARELLTEGLAVHPSFSSGHLVSGWVHREQGEVEAALSDFRKVLDLDPTNVSALRGVGELEEERRNHGPALESFRLLAEIEQRDVELAERVSTLATLLADEAAAAVEDEPPVAEEGVRIEFLEEEVEVEPEAVAIGSLAPDVAEALVDEPEAVAIGSLAPDVAEPEPPEEVVTRTMAKIYARQGMSDRAIEVVDRLIEAEPGDESLTSLREELVRAASGKPAGKVIPEAGPAADVQVEEGNARDIVPIESLAPAQPDTLT